MKEKTLLGARKNIYQLLKILKYCTNSSAKSYDCKYAVHQVFRNKEPMENELGRSLKEVMDHFTIRGKFSNVRKELLDQGIKCIKLYKTSIKFFEADNGKYFYNLQTNGFNILGGKGANESEIMKIEGLKEELKNEVGNEEVCNNKHPCCQFL